MGYEFHITRKSNWSDDAGKVIQPDEWLALVSSLECLEPVCEVPVADGVLKTPPDWHSHRWNAHPEHRSSGPIFLLRSGNIDFGGKDPATMGFALQLAGILNARIVGDEGEEYTLEEVVGSAGDLSSNPVNPFTRQPVYHERRGLLEFRNGEWHLVSRRRNRFGLRSIQDRALLHFVIPALAPSSWPDGGKVHVRGSLSEPGAYGSDGSCGNVLYVLKVVSFESAS